MVARLRDGVPQCGRELVAVGGGAKQVGGGRGSGFRGRWLLAAGCGRDCKCRRCAISRKYYLTAERGESEKGDIGVWVRGYGHIVLVLEVSLCGELSRLGFLIRG